MLGYAKKSGAGYSCNKSSKCEKKEGIFMLSPKTVLDISKASFAMEEIMRQKMMKKYHGCSYRRT